tara:strand:+ start:279 stop:1112 length:834 start_codon:yes stop_codon:yes gene_type:complete
MNFKRIYQKIYYQFLKRHYYGITAKSRVLPDFLIIGAVRSGTTSLYYDICQHPSVKKAAYDEIGFFDDNYHLGLNWYRSMFPTEKKMSKIQKETGFCVTGEDTPFYIWNKNVIEKIKNLIPEIKLIVILRNPVDRAYSNYHLSVREGNENRSFKDAIREDIKFINYKKCNNEELTNIDFKKSYIAKGLYYDQLLNWFNTFDKKQICIVFTEDLRDNPEDTMQTIFKFLQLPFFSIKKYEKQKMSDYDDMEKEIRMELSRYYESYNEQLFELIKRRCW